MKWKILIVFVVFSMTGCANINSAVNKNPLKTNNYSENITESLVIRSNRYNDIDGLLNGLASYIKGNTKYKIGRNDLTKMYTGVRLGFDEKHLIVEYSKEQRKGVSTDNKTTSTIYAPYTLITNGDFLKLRLSKAWRIEEIIQVGSLFLEIEPVDKYHELRDDFKRLIVAYSNVGNK